MKINQTFFILALSFLTMTSAIPAPAPMLLVKPLPGLNLNSISVGDILKLSTKEYSLLKGERLSLKQKIVFNRSQKALRIGVKKNILSESSIMNFNDFMQDAEKKFNLGGFILGFLLGLIGVALAHIFSQDKNFRRSSWQGLGGWIILVLVLYLV